MYTLSNNSETYFNYVLSKLIFIRTLKFGTLGCPNIIEISNAIYHTNIDSTNVTWQGLKIIEYIFF
jgi:hypothetical protein